MTHFFPSVVIILPIRNESGFIEHGLRAILEQDYPGEVEILIADGMSTDNTREIIDDFSARHPQLKICILDNPREIVPTGINIALRKAKGEIVIRLDGHTTIAPDYVRQCVETLQRTHADNVGGKMNSIGSNPFGHAVALATSTPFGIGGGRFHYSDKEEWVDTVYMGAWPRRVFEKIGMFDEELVRDQDDEFNYRLRAYGGKIFLSPKIRSTYSVRSDLRTLWRQYFQYGFWKVRVLQKHPRQMCLRQFVPPVFVLALLISAFLALSTFFFPFLHAQRPSFILCLSSFLPALYLLVNLAASIYTSHRRRAWSRFPFLILAFAILHLSYGLGFLVGLASFADRWGDKHGATPVFVGKEA